MSVYEMKHLSMKTLQLCILLLYNCGADITFSNNWTFLSQLQELCPYSSFCEANAILRLPENDKLRPCCGSCSCKPGCKMYDTCCYDFDKADQDWRKCTSPYLSNIERLTTNYYMVQSCSFTDDQPASLNKTMCEYNRTNFNSFSPVLSRSTGYIYVNSECAFCNRDFDIVRWNLVVNCQSTEDDISNIALNLLRGDGISSPECFPSYAPPKRYNVKSQECKMNVIRRCNMTGIQTNWKPFWDFCPLFNATFSITPYTSYGNVFCYMCNEMHYDNVRTLTANRFDRTPLGNPFIVVLEGLNPADLDGKVDKKQHGQCGVNEVLVYSLTTACRRVECSWGQFRLGDKCGFYSKEWIGGPFTVVLKLIPLDRLEISTLSNIPSDLKNDKNATWLRRHKLHNWGIDSLYRPSIDETHVEYLVVFATFPHSFMNPLRLQELLKNALMETWLLVINNSSVRIKPEFNPFRYYKRKHKNELLSQNLTINAEYGYTNMLYTYTFDKSRLIDKEQYLLEVFYDNADYIYKAGMFINELFLCEQIDLYPEEYVLTGMHELVFNVTDTLLHQSQFKIIEADTVRVCLNNFPNNDGIDTFHYFKQVVAILVLWVCLAC